MALGVVVSCSGNDDSGGPATTRGRPSPTSALQPPAAPATTAANPSSLAVPAAVTRPNVVVVMTDDQTMDELKVMPHVQALAKEGVSFPSSIVTYPLCCPSRASFFTAQYAHNHGVQWNSGPTGGYAHFLHQETSMPASLQAAGYRTSHIGKFLNGYGDKKTASIPKGFDNFQGLMGPSTGQYFGYTINDNGVLRQYPKGPDDYQTDVLTDLAVRDIDAANAQRKPFFLSVAYLAPHAQFGCALDKCTSDQIAEEREYANIGFGHAEAVPAPKYKGRFATEALPKPPNFDVATKGGSTGDDRPPLGSLDIEAITTGYRSELESLLSVDDGVARILDKLHQLNLSDRTIVVFTSDNGFFHGEHRLRYGKYLPYEESLKVPLIVSGPGVARGGRNLSVVTNVDLSTTLMAWAGATPLRPADGNDIRPLLAKPAAMWPRAVLVEGLGPANVSQPQYLGLRSQRYVYFEFTGGTGRGVELYDLALDPYQLTNVANDPRYRTVRREMAATTARLTLCAGDDCNREIGP